jgi:hypothetical protein
VKATRLVVAAGVLLLPAVLATGCGSKGMRAISAGQSAIQPTANDAVVVFMRPSPVGDIYSSSLFELGPQGDRFIGIITSGTRLAYRANPGRTRFMIVNTGGGDQFMDAELAGGKTYYAMVNYESIGSRSTYVLKPADQHSADFKACSTQCVWSVNTPKSDEWGRRHQAEVAKRKTQSLPAWEAQPNRATLTLSDGR